ncbi:MAG: 2-hydroxychromene-2-carboxylate isomerase [Alphaproteobacteria bacterium]|nr:2-hydroxychromene-2-carboxylate isomerase [Alphaproteobacteria bacterium]MBU0803607.1 2-hydroxychromene-2-carboxylate isomerase [Alphaproteobacteria bacterium]MBU0873096.1 2-hydroxychromene-2-carboxylate isomerase [Alphaproteobacteria bacterium]MBU1402534.1 2-hydroxychromene-2-carboxylate isomerase [Alphaproteobacteria bacterium]MBU1593176.1 2-hydroxychromene-2-carboxylate isomerase [Alphaproteobacteria bacterium]
MPATIDYYLSSVSPWTYLGHGAICDLAARHGANLVVKPVNLGEMFKVSGQVGLADRPQVRQRYRLIELQRYADWRGMKLTLRPKFFPTNPALADHTICAIIADGGDPLDYMASVFAAIWADERDIADEATLSALLSAAGFDAAAVLARAKTPEVAAIRTQNTGEAILADATGVPCFVLNGEPFWGQDRLDMLEHALVTGRASFRAS